MSVRLGAVTYLNARPLVYGLETETERFSLQFDLPSKCSELLHNRSLDVGLIPSIEYLHGPDYYIVPGIAVASQKRVASVALFTARAVSDIRTIATDTSSRTSVTLLRVLCARRFHIAPRFEAMSPDLPKMLERCDAALVIGDPALFINHQDLGVQKIDFGDEWRSMTGLPFVYAFWAGWPGVLTSQDVNRLRAAKEAGAAHVDEVARKYFNGDDHRTAIGTRYLRENVSFDLGGAECEGVQRFFTYAAELELVPSAGRLRFYGGADAGALSVTDS